MESGEDRGKPAVVLDSWKAIACYLNRDVSTVQRWERTRGLPVHRLPGGRKGGVYAVASELEVWRSAGHSVEANGIGWRFRNWVLAAAVLVVILATPLLWMGRAKRPSSVFRFKPLISMPGEETDPSFSRDGLRLVLSYRPEGSSNFDLYVMEEGKLEPLRLTSTPENERHAQWSPNGRQIAFLKQSPGGVEVWVMNAAGGGERRVSRSDSSPMFVESAPEWTKSGDGLILPGRESRDEPEGLYLLDLAAGKRRRLTRPPPGTIGDSFPKFSPDWKQLAFLRQGPSRIHEIWLADLNGTRQERPISAEGFGIAGLAWSGDGQRVLYVSGRGGPDPAVWSLDARAGRPELVTVLPAYSRNLALSARTGEIAFTKHEVRSSIWRYDLTGSSGEPLRLIGYNGVQAMPRYSPDGKSIAFMSDRAGGFELWVSDADGGNPRRLTDLGGEGGSPRWSPDGGWVAFDVRKGGQHQVLKVSSAGGPAVELTRDRFENGAPSWSGDGAWVYFGSHRSGAAEIWRVPARGGEPERITWNGGMIAYEAPGGNEIYYSGPRQKPGIFRKRLGAKEELVAVKDYRFGHLGMWQLTRSGICYLELEAGREGEHPVILLKPYSGAPAKRLAVLPPRATPNGYLGGLTIWHPISISPDERSLLLTQLDERQSKIMVSDRPEH